MGEILVSTTILICIVMIIRKMTMGRISMSFRYALWFIVALRLVVPVSIGSSPFSILNLMPEKSNVIGSTTESALLSTGTEGSAMYASAAGTNGGVNERTHQENGLEQSTDTIISNSNRGVNERVVGKVSQLDLRGNKQRRFLMIIVWAAGILIVGGYMLISQICFVRYLHRMRKEISAEDVPVQWSKRLKARKIHIYMAAGIPSPCLVGRDIYIEPQMLTKEDTLTHIVAHEYTHAVHGDTIWAVVRSALCAIYWFYPFIWLAAYEAKKDSELACDEHVVRILGESERFAYGRTLLTLLAGTGETCKYTGAVPITGGGKVNIKERISVIAGKKKKSKAVAIFAALITVFVCGCTFTGPDMDRSPSGTGKEILLKNKGSLSVENMAVSEIMEEPEYLGKGQAEEGQRDTEPGGKNQETAATEGRIFTQQQEATVAEYDAAFMEALYYTEDSGLRTAEMADYAAYSKYLYENADFPFADGQWYRLRQEEENGIYFYGLYTQEYGFRGLKIKLGDDVNTFDQTWLPVAFPIDVVIMEESGEGGMPRSFAFKVCVANSGSSEIWRLYVADRYDSGTIELSCFEEEEAWKQMDAQKISILVEQTEEKVELIDEEDMVIDVVNVSEYTEMHIEKAMWDEGSLSYSLEEEGDSRIALVTGIGLKVSGSEKTFYQNLPLISFPVEIGSFGDRKFALGRPYVSESYVSGRLNG